MPAYLPDRAETREDLAEYYQATSRLDATFGAVLDVLRETGHDDDTLVIFMSDNGIPFPGAKTTQYDPGTNSAAARAQAGATERGQDQRRDGDLGRPRADDPRFRRPKSPEADAGPFVPRRERRRKAARVGTRSLPRTRFTK